MSRNVNLANAQQSGFIIARNIRDGKIQRLVSAVDMQLGTSDLPCELHVMGRSSFSSTTSNFTESGQKYNIDNNITNNFIRSDYKLDVYLPARPRLGQLVTVKDTAGVASGAAITIYGADGATIDGVISKSIYVNYGSFMFIWNGNEWSTICTNINSMVLYFGAASTSITGGDIRWLTPGGTSSAATSSQNGTGIIMPFDGVLHNLIARHRNVGTGNQTIAYEPYNETGGTLTGHVTAIDVDTGSFDSDTSTFAPVSKGDLIFIRVTTSTTITTSPTGLQASITLSHLTNSV
jgi:hypothetical protein